ncbi:hypothetical protein BH09DEP1_BH09DEP1_2910 [soil metagenome]
MHEQNRWNKGILRSLYSLGNILGDSAGLMYLMLACRGSQQADGSKATLIYATVGIGAFMASCYCRSKKNKIIKLPIPTKQEIYESEKKSNGSNAVEYAMKLKKLDPKNPFADAIKQEEVAAKLSEILASSNAPAAIKDKHQSQLKKYLHKLRKKAFLLRDIDAILAITEHIDAEKQ